MDALDKELQSLYAQFVEDGGLDQTTNIVSEEFERIERQVAFCVHGEVRRKCGLCSPTKRSLPAGMGGYDPP